MPGAHTKRFTMGFVLIPIKIALVTIALAHSCNQQDVDFKDHSPVMSDIIYEMFSTRITPPEIKKCFGDGVKNTSGDTVYPLIREKSGKKRYCHITFFKPNKTSRIFITTAHHENYTEIACRMRALKCLRPTAYERIKKRYNVDEN